MRTNQLRVLAGLAVGAAAIVAACAPVGQLIGDPRPPQGPPGAVTCERTSGQQAKEIGQQRDSLVLSAPAGPGRARRHVLVVPNGSVPPGQMIRFRLEDAGEDYVSVRAHHHGPPAHQFNPPLTLRLSYAGCGVTDPRQLHVYRWQQVARTSGPAVWEWVEVRGATVNTAREDVSVERDDLSQYALGAG